MKDNSENYYVVLNIMDRIAEHALEKFGTYAKFSRALGYTDPYFYQITNLEHFFKINNLIKAAKALDLSVEYLLTGKRKEPFNDEKLSVKNVLKLKVPKYAINNSLCSIQCHIKSGRTKSMNIKTLLEFESASGVKAMDILRGRV